MKDLMQFHTVTLDASKCKGCVACMKRCPTEAIRVRDGKAYIHYDRCVNCGECVRICPHGAKKVIYDELSVIDDPKYKYKVALPAPSLYGQFDNLDDLNYLLEGLLAMGFDDVYEVAKGAELISDVTRNLIEGGTLKKPIISTACPAVLELIMIRFHDLAPHLLKVIAPVDVSAKLAREKAVLKTGLKAEEIGIFFITPCPAKVHALKMAVGVDAPLVDGVLSASECYFKLLDHMKDVKNPRELSEIGVFGLSWASSGGESASLLKNRYLAADGMENVVNVLTDMENGKLRGLDFIELNACVSGCVGGVLNIENPCVAKAKLRRNRKYLPISKNSLEQEGKPLSYYMWSKEPKILNVLRLHDDFAEAMAMMEKINKVEAMLPMLDCGSCGAPSCRAFAEDVVAGEATITGCHRLNMKTEEKQ